MAIAARKMQSEYAYPAARVYSQRSEALRLKREQEAAEEERRQRAEAARRKAAREAAVTRLFMLSSVAVAALAMIFVLTRYSKISREYAAVNALKTSIEDTTLEITSLRVQLNGAVSLPEARAAAEEAGLGYPTAEQIVTVSPGGAGMAGAAAADAIEVLE